MALKKQTISCKILLINNNSKPIIASKINLVLGLDPSTLVLSGKILTVNSSLTSLLSGNVLTLNSSNISVLSGNILTLFSSKSFILSSFIQMISGSNPSQRILEPTQYNGDYWTVYYNNGIFPNTWKIYWEGANFLSLEIRRKVDDSTSELSLILTESGKSFIVPDFPTPTSGNVDEPLQDVCYVSITPDTGSGKITKFYILIPSQLPL